MFTLTWSFNRWSLEESESLEDSEWDKADAAEIEYRRTSGAAPEDLKSPCSNDDVFRGSNPLTSQFQRFLCSPIHNTLALFSLALRFDFWIRELQNLLRRELFFSSLGSVLFYFYFISYKWREGGFWFLDWVRELRRRRFQYICDTLQLFSSHVYLCLTFVHESRFALTYFSLACVGWFH